MPVRSLSEAATAVDYTYDLRKHFGALGGGEETAAQDTAALVAAFAAVNQANGRIHVPPGDYVVAETLRQVATRGVWIEGDGAAVTRIRWGGPSSAHQQDGRDVLQLINCYTGGIEKISIEGNSQHRADSCVNIIEDVSGAYPNLYGSSQNAIRDVQLGGDGSNAANFGLRVSCAASSDQNNEGHLFENIRCQNVGEVCAKLEHSQGREHLFLNCIFQNAKYGVDTTGGGAGANCFTWIGGQINVMTASAINIGSPNVYPIRIFGCLFESNFRVLSMINTITGATIDTPPFPVTFDSCWMLGTNKMAPDRRLIDYRGMGPLIVRGCGIGYGDTTGATRPRIRMNARGGSQYRASLIVEGNFFNHYRAYEECPIELSSNGYDAPVEVTYRNNLFSNNGDAVQAPPNPWSGSVTIADGATAGTVVFPFSVNGNKFRIRFGAGPLATGAPAAGAETISSYTVTDDGSNRPRGTGFVVCLKAAPGVGSSVTFEWEMV